MGGSYDLQFVDSITVGASVRLDLNAAPYTLFKDTDFGMPELRRAATSTLLTDGERYPAAAYGNRMIRLVLQLNRGTDDDAATAVQRLARELDRPTNILRYRPGTSTAVHFRTFRAAPQAIRWDPELRQITAVVPAEPFALGTQITLPPMTVYNDPAEGTTLNGNPYFETDASNWAGTGGTVARSTAQFHQGAASLLLTPGGVATDVDAHSEMVPTAVGTLYRASAWVRCAVARTVDLTLSFLDAGGITVSSTTTPVAVAATTWTLIEVYDTAPPGTTQAQMIVEMGSTPPAGHLLYIDEARIRATGDQSGQPNGPGGLCFDIAGVRGDVETPVLLEMPVASGLTTLLGGPSIKTVVGTRRRGTPSDAWLCIQAEQLTTLSADTTVQAHDPVMSGDGQNFLRVSFATTPGMTHRAGQNFSGVEQRGTFRAFARIRRSDATSVIRMRADYGTNLGHVTGDPVTLPLTASPVVVDLGLISVPACADPIGYGYSGEEINLRGAVGFGAERVSGSGTLDVDYIALVPADDQLMIIDWPDGGGTGGDLARIDGPSGVPYIWSPLGYLVRVNGPFALAGASAINVSPGVTNRVFWLRTVDWPGDNLADSTVITASYWPRYLYVAPVGS